MKKLLALLCILCGLPAHAQRINYFPPPGMGYNFSTTAPSLTFSASGAPANAKQTAIQIGTDGSFNIVPLTDAGAVIPNNHFQIQRISGAFSAFSYQDTGAGISFNIAGNDMKYVAGANTQPAFIMADPGIGDAAAGNVFYTGTGAVGNQLSEYCVAPAFSLGAGLNNGPANNYCVISSGDILFDFAPSNAPLVFGAHANYYGQLDPSGNWVLDPGQTHATNSTNGFVYLPKTAGIPTGTPANLSGFYGTSVPFLFDSTDNRLYAYNAGWQNLTPAATALANPSGLIGLTAVNGVATTATRSDGTHALDQSIAPTWTGVHNWSGLSRPIIATNSGGTTLGLIDSAGATDAKRWEIENRTNSFGIQAVNDAINTGRDVLTATRSGVAVATVGLGNATDTPSISGNGVVMTPSTGTFTSTFTGLTAALTCTSSWYKIGLIITLHICGQSGTSNSTSFTMTGLPAAIQPSATNQSVAAGRGVNGGSAVSGIGAEIVAGSGTITFDIGGSGTSWNAASNKGLFGDGLTITYLAN